MNGEAIIGKTESVCPECLRRIPAEHVRRGGDVYMIKSCPSHGTFRMLIWEGPSAMEEWSNDRIFSKPERCATDKTNGCPFDCGLCPDHRQQTCCVLLEVTQRCNLSCPVCFASAGASAGTDPSLERIEEWYRILAGNGGGYNIQLSGGEPTMRDDLPQIIERGRSYGFRFFQLNTNGLRLADKNYVEILRAAGLDCAFLQFDGTDDAVYESIRGSTLLKKKEEAIRNCGEAGIGVVLVPTIVPGINDDNIGEILRFALDRMPAVRGVHFQPISYFGRFPGQPPTDRMTIPRMLSLIETQTGGLMKAEHFSPPGGEHERCSFHGNFILNENGSLTPMSSPKKNCCDRPIDAADGMRKARSFVARQWSAAKTDCGKQPLDSLDLFLKRASSQKLAVSGMLFQDAWNLDLERLKSCHIHVMSPDGKLVPFCAYNLTAKNGRSLYRGTVAQKIPS